MQHFGFFFTKYFKNGYFLSFWSRLIILYQQKSKKVDPCTVALNNKNLFLKFSYILQEIVPLKAKNGPPYKWGLRWTTFLLVRHYLISIGLKAWPCFQHLIYFILYITNNTKPLKYRQLTSSTCHICTYYTNNTREERNVSENSNGCSCENFIKKT